MVFVFPHKKTIAVGGLVLAHVALLLSASAAETQQQQEQELGSAAGGAFRGAQQRAGEIAAAANATGQHLLNSLKATLLREEQQPPQQERVEGVDTPQRRLEGEEDHFDPEEETEAESATAADEAEEREENDQDEEEESPAGAVAGALRRLSLEADDGDLVEDEETEADIGAETFRDEPETEFDGPNDLAGDRQLSDEAEDEAGDQQDTAAAAEAAEGFEEEAEEERADEPVLRRLEGFLEDLEGNGQAAGGAAGEGSRRREDSDAAQTEEERAVAELFEELPLEGALDEVLSRGDLTQEEKRETREAFAEAAGGLLRRLSPLASLDAAGEERRNGVASLEDLLDIAGQAVDESKQQQQQDEEEQQESSAAAAGDSSSSKRDEAAARMKISAQELQSVLRQLIGGVGEYLSEGPVSDVQSAAEALKRRAVQGGENIGKASTEARRRMRESLEALLARSLLAFARKNPEVFAAALQMVVKMELNAEGRELA